MCDSTGRGKAPGLSLFSSLIASAEILRPPKRSKISGFATATAYPQKADGWQGSKSFPKTKIMGDILWTIYFLHKNLARISLFQPKGFAAAENPAPLTPRQNTEYMKVSGETS